MPLDARRLDLALATHDAPRLGAVLDALDRAPDLTPTRRRDLASAVRRVAAAIGYTPDVAPADPAWLRPRIQRVAPAAVGVSAKTWTNVLSDFRAALRHAGVRSIRGAGEAAPPSRAWAALRDALPCRRCRIGLTRFMRFCANLGVAPEEVDDAHLVAFHTAVAATELRKPPHQLVRDVALLWNRAASLVADWPAHRLAVPDRRKRVALPISVFPSSFSNDLEAHLAILAAPDVTDPDAPAHPLSPRSIDSHRSLIIGFASARVRGGRDPVTLRSLANLIDPTTVREGLRKMMGPSNGRPRQTDHRTAIVLRSVARWRVKASPQALAELSDIVRRVTPKATAGMTAKNRGRLRQFDDPAAIKALLRLPERLVRRAEQEADPPRAARRMEMAVAIGVLIHCPMRIQNLRRLDLALHFERRGGKPVRIVIPAGEVKNSQELDFPIPTDLAALIDRFDRKHRRILNPAPGDLLFPQRGAARPVGRDALGKAISRAIRDETGLEVNPHLFRHVSAKIFLRAQPGAYEAVRRLLAHSRTSSTLDAYAGFETDAAARAYATILEGAAASAPRKRRRP